MRQMTSDIKDIKNTLRNSVIPAEMNANEEINHRRAERERERRKLCINS
jgi:hypothetical protein